MRAVIKRGDGGYQLSRSHAVPPTTSDQARSRWGSFQHKIEVASNLTREQYSLCAYSEIRPDIAGLGTHIEHVEPKSQNPTRTFDYSNLILSALSQEDLRFNKIDVFGGHAKRSEYCADKFISCLHHDCGIYFVYLSNGKVEPAATLEKPDRERALYTIETLNLNCPYLVTQRKKWLDELDELIDSHIDTNQSLEHLASIDLLPKNDTLSQFFTATRQRFGNIAEKILAIPY